MKRHLNYNNSRRSILYWGSLFVLLFLNISARDIGERNIPSLFHLGETPVGIFIVYFLCSLIGVGLVALYNFLFNLLPCRIKNRENLLLRFLYNKCFWGDVILGGALLVLSIFSIFAVKRFFANTVVYFWAVVSAVCLVLLFRSIFSWKAYRTIRDKLIGGNAYEGCVWLGITNGQLALSAFDLLPKNGKPSCPLVDEQDLDYIEKKYFVKTDYRAFRYYLVLIDANAEITDAFRNKVITVSKLPHAHIVIWHTKKTKVSATEELISKVSSYKNVITEVLPRCEISDGVISNKLVQIGFPQLGSEEFPPRFLNNGAILQQYYALTEEPAICHNFLVMILQKLSLKPSIYALFDYIDLQYRVKLAYNIAPNHEWLEGNSENIGKIQEMRKLLGEELFINSCLELTSLDLCDPDSFLSESEYKLIHRYLPVYEKLVTPNAVTYLSKELRNVIRGHGTFKDADTKELFELVFKLAVLTASLLQTNKIETTITEEHFWHDNPFFSVFGSMRNEEPKCLSPIIVGDVNNTDYLVFNNFISNDSEAGYTMEYVDYLSGKLILPHFRLIELQTSDINDEEE